MYAGIQYNNLATIAEMIADIVGLATGTITTIGGLSANSVPAGSTVTTTVAGGWVVYDNISATDVVLRAEISDMAGEYKYIRLQGSGNNLLLIYYKSWNNIAHTGVEWRKLRSNVVETNIVFVAATGNAVLCLSSSNLHFGLTGRVNNLATNRPLQLITEHARISPWDTVGNAIPPIIYTYGLPSQAMDQASGYNVWFIKPKTVDATGVLRDLDESTTSGLFQYFQLSPLTAYGGYAGTPHGTLANGPDFVYDAPGGAQSYLLFPISAFRLTDNIYVGDISAKCGFYMSSIDSNSAANTNDLVVIGGQNYRIWIMHASYKYMVVAEK